ncbi:MAG: hypothetical protein QRY71_05320 [Candidatus Rhabdochlamydia sp.]
MVKVIGVALLLEANPLGFDSALLREKTLSSYQRVKAFLSSYFQRFQKTQFLFSLLKEVSSFFTPQPVSHAGVSQIHFYKKFDAVQTPQGERCILIGSHQNLDIALHSSSKQLADDRAKLFSELDEISQQLCLTYKRRHWAYNDHFDWKCKPKKTFLSEPQQECIFRTSGKEMARNSIKYDKAKPLSNMAKKLNNKINWEI